MRPRASTLALPLLLAACRTSAGGEAARLGLGAPDGTPAEARRAGAAGATSGADVEHYALELELLPREGRLNGRCRVRFLATQDDLRAVPLDLAGFEVSGATDADGRACAVARDGDRLVVELPEPLEHGSSGEVVIDFAGAPPDGVWFVGGPGEVRYAYTLGSGSPRAWFPSIAGDRATCELEIRVPGTWKVGATGQRIDAGASWTDRWELWRSVWPLAPERIGFVAGELAQRRELWEGVELEWLAPLDDAPRLEAVAERTRAALAALTRVLGRPAPFLQRTLAFVEGYPFAGGGASLSLFDTGVLAGTDAARVELACELARAWFAGLAPAPSERWIVDGLAAHVGLVALDPPADPGEQTLRRERAYAARARDVEAGRPAALAGDPGVAGDAGDLGALRIEHLRAWVGDDAFWRGVRLLAADRRSGRTERALHRAMERAMGAGRAAGPDLAELFAGWWSGAPEPRFEVHWRFERAAGRVLLAVNQVHAMAGVAPRAYATPAEVEVLGAGGLSTHRVSIEKRREVFSIPAREPPRWVRFDPGRRIPARVDERKSIGEWSWIAAKALDFEGRAVALDAIVRGALDAEEGEARLDIARGLAGERLARDPSPEVRALAALALRRLGGAAAQDALARAALADPDPRVRVRALSSLARLDARASRGVAARVLAQGPPPEAQAAAIGVLAATDSEDGARHLLDALQRGGPPELVGPLVAELGGYTGDEVDRELVRWAVDEQAPGCVRVEAARSLARGPRGAAVRVALERMLDSSLPSVRLAAVAALASADVQGGRSALAARHDARASSFERRAIEAALRHP